MSDFPNGYLNPTYTGDVKGNSVNVDLFSISKFHEALKKYLKSQGLEYKDGEIVETQRTISAEAKEAIFEDEDERIRKALIHFFSKSATRTFEYWEAISNEEVVSWLEKQGEKKLVKHLELKAGHWYICHRAYCCRADCLTVKEKVKKCIGKLQKGLKGE